MARIGVVSAAYWGDVMPFVPIARELCRRGHQVSFVVPEGFHDVLRAEPFDLVHLGTDFSPRELAAHGDIIERSATMRGMRAALELWVKQLCIDPIDAILAALDEVAPDLWLVHNTAAWIVELQARPTGTPYAAGHLFPMMVPTSHRPPPMLPLPADVPGAVARAAWSMGRRSVAMLGYDREVNEIRARRGLPPAFASTGFGWERADRVLVLTSPTYWPVPDDWGDHVVATGLTVWGHPDDPLPADLHDHLDTDQPVVLVTLGTSAASNARDAFVLAGDAIEALGCRPVLLTGTADGLTTRDDAWAFAPLPAVLPHVDAVVHAAGHGSLTAALHAAVPQVTMAQTFDQVVHARRLAELGVGVDVPWRRRSPQRLERALQRVLTDGPRARAREIADRLAREDGPGRAADELEAMLD